MSNKSYNGDVGTVVMVNCGFDISSATAKKLYVKKPDGKEVVWTPTIYNSMYLKYTIAPGDIDQSGEYYLQAYIEISSWKGRGETALFSIYGNYK